MDWLNYHHLFYFWTVAKDGSIARASETLRLSQPTISAQIRALESSLGEQLFQRVGRRLVLTEVGRLAFQYAEEIFSLGREFTDTLRGRPSGKSMRLRAGVADAVPKQVAYRLLSPALRLRQGQRVQLVCREDGSEYLLADLAVHRLDLVLTDAPLDPSLKVQAFSHLLADSPVAVYARGRAASGRKATSLAGLLDGAPFLQPGVKSALRRSLDSWFASAGIAPQVTGEFDDFSLLIAFAERGRELFAAPELIGDQLRRAGFRKLGRLAEVRARFYAISLERKIKHPGVSAICAQATLQPPAAARVAA